MRDTGRIRIVLASASPRRKELLRQVGLDPEILPSRADEAAEGLPPEEMVRELSRRKAAEVAGRLKGGKPERTGTEARKAGRPEAEAQKAERLETEARKAERPETEAQKAERPGDREPEAGSEPGRGTVIIGADTVVAVDGRILGKPKSEADAADMLELLQGRVHHVYTGVTMLFADSGESVTFSEQTEVTVYPMTPDQIERYIATGEPMDKAGAYGIQGRFAAYIRGIRGDYNNVVGLPVARVCWELALRGMY